MTDLMKGWLEVAGFTFHPRTRLEEVQNHFGERLRVKKLGDEYVARLDGPCYITAHIYAYSFNFKEDGFLKSYTLHPVAPPMIQDQGHGEIPKYKLEVAKKWLQCMLPVVPQTLNDTAVGYTLAGVGYYASVRNDAHYGIVGGEISVLISGG